MKIHSFSICFCIFFLFTGTLASNIFRRKHATKKKICETDACTLATSYMSQNMDRSVQACDNFYKFACGGFLKRIQLFPQESSVNTFSLIQTAIKQQLKAVIIKNQNNPKKSKAFMKLQQFYDVCLAGDRKSKSNDEYIKILRNNGGWPVLVGSFWRESKFHWSKTAVKLAKEGLFNNFFISLAIPVGVKDNTKRHVVIDQGDFGLSEKYLTQGWSNEIVKAYYNYMVSVAVHFKAEPSRALKECQEVLNFQMQLAKIGENEEERIEHMRNSKFITIGQLQSEYPFMQWLVYLKELFSPVKLSNDEPLVVIAPLYFSKLGALLRVTPARVQANYAYWRTTQELVDYLGPDVQSAKEEYDKVLTGSQSTYDRHETCFARVIQNFPLAMGSLYVRNYVDDTTKPNVQSIFENIRLSLSNVINEVKWMRNATKARAFNKLDAMESAIAYPNELLDDDKIDEYYSGFDVVKGDFLRTILNYNQYSDQMSLRRLREKVERIDWTTEFGDVVQSNAYSDLQANAIVIPAGIAQIFFYDNNRPMYLNYGALGSFVGHEIVHGFDNSGRMFDESGNLNDWWDAESAEAYKKKVECIVEQYSNYTVKDVGLPVDGENTQDENIADNGGIKVTYRAYRNWLEKNGPEQTLRGFEAYSESQMFWLTNANAWCHKIRPEQLKQTILFDKHTPFELRVNGVFSNSDEFARDFSCPPGSPMNPIDKCVIW